MNGKPQVKSISRALPVNTVILEIILLSLLGALAMILRARLRVPIQLPGHHGLEVMAILMIGRKISTIPVATTISAVAGGLTTLFPFMGFGDPFMLPIYILLGVFIDVIYMLVPSFRNYFLLLILLGGLAYMLIPLSRILIVTAGLYQYPSLARNGFLYPVMTHFMFGAGGATLGGALVMAGKRILKKPVA
jgi:hypothetical protein